MSKTGKYTRYLHQNGFRADLEGLRPRPGETWIRNEDGMQVDEDVKRVEIEVHCPTRGCEKLLGSFYRHTSAGVFGDNPRSTQFDHRFAASVKQDGGTWRFGCRTCPSVDEQCRVDVIDTWLEQLVSFVGDGGRMSVRLDVLRGRRTSGGT